MSPSVWYYIGLSQQCRKLKTKTKIKTKTNQERPSSASIRSNFELVVHNIAMKWRNNLQWFCRQDYLIPHQVCLHGCQLCPEILSGIDYWCITTEALNHYQAYFVSSKAYIVVMRKMGNYLDLFHNSERVDYTMGKTLLLTQNGLTN